MRRGASLVLAAALGVLAVVLRPVVPAAAQGEAPGVRLTLLKQTAFAAPDRPLRIRVRARNDTETTYRDLTMSLWIYSAARSRSEYGEAMEAEPLSVLRVTTSAVSGVLEEGTGRPLPTIESRLPVLADRDENALYPIKVQLASADVPLAEVRSVLTFVDERIVLPLDVSVTFVLDPPVRFRPDGALLDDALERQVSPGGRVDAVISALQSVPIPATVVVSPLMLQQLRAMGTGYSVVESEGVREVAADDVRARRAREALERLRAVASRPDTEVTPLPYAAPSVPALVEVGLTGDLRAQIEHGRAVVESILGVEPSTTVFRPPGAALTEDSLDALAVIGEGAVVVDPDTLNQAPFTLTPSPIAELPTPGGRTLRVIAPDLGVASRMDDLPDDPRLRAMRTIGELSAIYFERPGTGRGVSLLVGEDVIPEPAFLRTLLEALASQPPGLRWLRPVTAARLLAGVGEPTTNRTLARARATTLSSLVLAELLDARDAAGEYGQVAAGTRRAIRLRELTFAAESRHLLNREEQALTLVRSVDDAVRREFAKVDVPSPGTITLTSRGGPIPVTLRNNTGYEIQVRLTLLSSDLEFLGGPSRRVTLSRPVQRFDFPVLARSTGRFPVTILVQTPGGQTISESQAVVRSTAYNRVALIVTAGAALFLALWWSRRFLPGRRRA